MMFILPTKISNKKGKKLKKININVPSKGKKRTKD